MRPLTWPLALLAASSSVLAATNCTESLYILVARGSGEPAGTGAFGNISKAIASKIDDSIVEALDYPATFTDPIYSESEKDGVKEMHEVISDYHKACPKAKFTVLGYSQGGQVASDTFCGGSGDGFSTLSALSSDLVENYFAAIVLFGDPSHVANITYDRGTSKNDGIFARDNVTFCEKHYGSIIRSFCDTGDIYCDAGNDTEVHGSYFEKYNKTVIDFVVSRYDELKDASTATATTAAPTSSASSTSTSASDENIGQQLTPHLAFVMTVSLSFMVLDWCF